MHVDAVFVLNNAITKRSDVAGFQMLVRNGLGVAAVLLLGFLSWMLRTIDFEHQCLTGPV